MTERDFLATAAAAALRYVDELPGREVGATATAADMHRILGGPLPAGPGRPEDTLALLQNAADAGGVVASSGARYFGYVIGGTLPAALATDWLVSAWDQSSGIFGLGPAAATAEHIAGQWLVDLLGLPPGTSAGFPTGCTMGHLTALAAARHHLLAEAGWDVEHDGLQGAPKITVVAGAKHHITIRLALRYLGVGTAAIRTVSADDQGRMVTDTLAEVLAGCPGPTIVCAQVGEVNSGCVDPVGEIADIAHRYGAWVHVDGAFGLWAAASPRLRHLVAGVERADSWASDAHKWLNVPYDCGLVFVSRPEAHRAAMLDAWAPYLPPGAAEERDPIEWVPELSRRARSLPVWAALRTLGRAGVADLIERCCAHAHTFADRLAELPGVEILNDVVLNQVLVRFGDDDSATQKVITRLQEGGECWFGGSIWRGVAVMRISVASWRTTGDDVTRAIEAIRVAAAEVLSA